MASADDVSLSDGLDASEVSPYRRRQKVVPVRRSRLARFKWLLRCFLWLVPAGLVALFVCYRLAVFARGSQVFALTSPEDVSVEGNRFTSGQEIATSLGLPSAGGQGASVNIFSFSLADAKKEVESIPWVLSATVMRVLPHQLAVRVTERSPVAFITVGGRVELVDGAGVLLEKPEKASFDFPVLSGLDSGLTPAERKQRLDLYQGFMRQVARDLNASGWMVSEVDLSDGDDLKATVFREGQTLQLNFGHSDFGQRFHNFLRLLPKVSSDTPQIDSMDLRYDGQVIVNPRPEAPRNNVAPRRRTRSRVRKE